MEKFAEKPVVISGLYWNKYETFLPNVAYMMGTLFYHYVYLI